MIAAIVLSRYNDHYYGQWLVMHVPFRKVDDFWNEAAAKVPEEFSFLTLCLLARPDHWRDPEKIKADLELEAFKDIHINNVLAMIKANTELIDLYLDGELILGVDPIPEMPNHPHAALRMEAEQLCVLRAMQMRTQRAMALRWPDDAADEDAEDEGGNAGRSTWEYSPHQPYIVLGPAGSGKTTSVEAGIREAVASGARVQIACPTGMLASAYRAKFPDLDVDTIHGAFLLFKPEQET